MNTLGGGGWIPSPGLPCGLMPAGYNAALPCPICWYCDVMLVGTWAQVRGCRGGGLGSVDGTDGLMSTHASILVDSVGPPSAEVCRIAASFP
jgi:hypothetical protein